MSWQHSGSPSWGKREHTASSESQSAGWGGGGSTMEGGGSTSWERRELTASSESWYSARTIPQQSPGVAALLLFTFTVWWGRTGSQRQPPWQSLSGSGRKEQTGIGAGGSIHDNCVEGAGQQEALALVSCAVPCRVMSCPAVHTSCSSKKLVLFTLLEHSVQQVRSCFRFEGAALL